MKKKQRILLIVLLVLFLGAYFGITTYNRLNRSLESLASEKIDNVDLSKTPDGTYTGSFKAFPVIAEVKVYVKNHEILDIELVKHQNGQGKPAEIIPGKVVEAQTLEVDAVSGATYSSKVILKAIEKALKSAK